MHLGEFKQILEQSKLPVAYSHFKKAQELPYIIYFVTDNEDLLADNQNYYDFINIAVELYSDDKDPSLEMKLQKLFAENEIVYRKSETVIQDENMYEVIYEIKLY